MTSPYTAYELNEGACLEDVEALCAQLTMAGTFGDETQPKGVTVERWITLSHHWIAGILAKNGYDTAQTDAEVVGILQELNALDVSVKCELANPLTGVGEPNERFIALKERRDELLEMIENSQMLTLLGATGTSGGAISENLAITGISKSRKLSVENDSDYVLPRFRKGMGRNPRIGAGTTAEVDIYPTDR